MIGKVYTTSKKAAAPTDDYVRPAEWLPLPTLTVGQQRIVILHAVFSHNSNFVAFTISGGYTVDWGDGIIENFDAAATAQHNFQYESFPTQTETSRGYKQSIINITPQSGQNFTNVNFNVLPIAYKYLGHYTQFLDMSIVGEFISSFSLGHNVPNYGTSEMIEIFNYVGSNLITNFSYFFHHLTSLKKLTELDTSKGTDFSYMFSECWSLTKIPLINTSNGISFVNMFYDDVSLSSVPELNVEKGISFTYMFGSCSSLLCTPPLNTKSGLYFNFMFRYCYLLQEIKYLDLISVLGDSTSPFSDCYSLGRVNIKNLKVFTSLSYNKLSSTSLNEIYTNLSTVIPSGTAVVFNSVENTVILNNHGLKDLRSIAFSTINTTTGIVVSAFYYVRNSTINTFQLSTTTTGTIIDLVNNGTGTVSPTYINVGSNWGTASDNPSIATSKGWTVTG